MHVCRLRLNSSNLVLRLGVLLEFSHLLTLNRRSRDLLTEDNITDLASGERRDVDTVALSEVREDEVLHRHLDLDPLLIRQRRPDEVWLGDGVLVGVQDDLGLFIVDVQTTE